MIWVYVAMMVATLGLIVAAMIKRRRRQEFAVDALGATIRNVRAGKAPIEELSNFSGNWGEVIDHIHEILHELRRRDQQICELNAEISQRIASRTDALERKLGSAKRQSMSDALTSLYNRRALDETLPRMIEQSVAENKSLALLMIDVNHFKDLNDTLGHAAGDQMLRDLGRIIASTIRDKDMAFRCGGDEFVVVLNNCGEAPAKKVATRLQSLVDALAAPLKLPPNRPVGLSIGLCTLEDLPEPTADAMLHCADELLYAAKAANKKKLRETALAAK
jgi:diguanylate cyclase (GGDEF)-like protein